MEIVSRVKSASAPESSNFGWSELRCLGVASVDVWRKLSAKPPGQNPGVNNHFVIG
jgi:hypothetical protein